MESAPSEFQGRISGNRDWREIVAWIGDLAPMPQVASRALTLVENPDTTAKELSDLLNTDAPLATRVLKIANSAMFARQREITTLNQAVMMIGFKSLKGIIVAAVLKQLNKSMSALEKMVWESSMSVGVNATMVAKRLKKNYTEEVFLLALLHNLGQFVLLNKPETAKDYKTIEAIIKDQNIDFVTAENEVLGFAHPLIGALVAKKWNFPPEVCQSILHYKDPVEDSKAETPAEEKCRVILVGELIARVNGIGTPEGYPDQTQELYRVSKTLGLDETAVNEICAKAKEQFEAERNIYEA